MRRLDALQTELAGYGVERVVGISPNTVALALRQRIRDGLTVDLWCDPDRVAIDAYGVALVSGMTFTEWRVLGVPFGIPKGFRRLAVPTTIVVDEHGIVRWIDQTDDYRMRSNSSTLLKHLERAFG